MTIHPGNLPDAAIVETTADHFAKGRTYLTTMQDVRERGDLTVLRVLLPIPDGVSLADAVDALAAIEPDADLIERMAEAIYSSEPGDRPDWEGRGDMIRDSYRQQARAALAVIRESEATR
jgi:hypothetical protein